MTSTSQALVLYSFYDSLNLSIALLLPRAAEWNMSRQQQNPAQKKAGVTQMTRILSLVWGHGLIPMMTMWRKSL